MKNIVETILERRSVRRYERMAIEDEKKQLIYDAITTSPTSHNGQQFSVIAIEDQEIKESTVNILAMLNVNYWCETEEHKQELLKRYQENDLKKGKQQEFIISIIFGVIVGIFGVIMAKTLLLLMDSPEEVIDLSALYVRIYFAGMPFTMLYNFGSAILRGMGDTRRPLIALSSSGILNVGLNMILVIGFNRSVDGVAIATVVSQAYACGMVLFFLRKNKDASHLSFKKLRLHKTELWFMARIGLPAGIQG